MSSECAASARKTKRFQCGDSKKNFDNLNNGNAVSFIWLLVCSDVRPTEAGRSNSNTDHNSRANKWMRSIFFKCDGFAILGSFMDVILFCTQSGEKYCLSSNRIKVSSLATLTYICGYIAFSNLLWIGWACAEISISNYVTVSLDSFVATFRFVCVNTPFSLCPIIVSDLFVFELFPAFSCHLVKLVFAFSFVWIDYSVSHIYRKTNASQKELTNQSHCCTFSCSLPCYSLCFFTYSHLHFGLKKTEPKDR